MSRTKLLVWGAIGFGSLGPVWGFASPVLAHAGLESSTPSASAVLESSPNTIVLDFSEPVTVVDGSVKLFDEGLDEVQLPPALSALASRVEVPEVPSLDDGLYLVSWRVMSQDGHLATGAFTFQIGTQSTSVSPDELLAGVSDSTRGPRGLGVLGHITRAAVYLGISAALGTLAFVAVVHQRRVRRIVALGWIAATIGTLVHFSIQGVYSSGTGWTALIDTAAWSDVSHTRLGRGLLVRLALLVILAVLMVLARGSSRSGGSDTARFSTRMSTGWWRSSTALIGAGIVATFAFTGHPSASSPAAVAIAVDAVHLSAVVLWFGGLLGILFAERTETIIGSYSRVATIALPAAVVTGIWQAWHLHDGATDLTREQWGRALVVKSSLVVIVATLGMVARWLVRADGTASIRRLVGVEVMAAIAIVVATSVLVSSPPQVGAESSVVLASLARDDIIANVTLTPGRVGPNEIHVTVVTPAGTLSPVEGMEIRLTRVGSDLPAVAVPVSSLGPNHFLGTVSILQKGEWNLELLVTVTPARVVLLSTSVVV